MARLVNILPLVPLALAAMSPMALDVDRAMIFNDTEFAVRNGRKGIEVLADGRCMNLDTVPEYRMNVGSIYVPCPSNSKTNMICTMYNDTSCGTEMFTFARPHGQLFRQTNGDDVGSHVQSIMCMMVDSPAVRMGHIFTSDRPSTMSPSSCPNDSCSSDMNCQAMHPNFNMFCDMNLMTCQRESLLGASCDPMNQMNRCREGTCVNGLCMAAAENMPCMNGVDCPSGLECRPYRTMDASGGSTVQKICLKMNDVRGMQCPCAEHMKCSLQSEGNMYCEWDGTCGLTSATCMSDSQCCSGKCNSQACQ